MYVLTLRDASINALCAVVRHRPYLHLISGRHYGMMSLLIWDQYCPEASRLTVIQTP